MTPLDNNPFILQGWKLFEEKNGQPRTLVHGLQNRSRMIELNVWLKKAPGTPGFCFFPTFIAAKKYLPRFTARANKLQLARVYLLNTSVSTWYHHADMFSLDENDWYGRIPGEVLCTSQWPENLMALTTPSL